MVAPIQRVRGSGGQRGRAPALVRLDGDDPAAAGERNGAQLLIAAIEKSCANLTGDEIAKQNIAD
jgi:hypothetical protein